MRQNRDEIIALVKIGGDAAQSLSGSRILAEWGLLTSSTNFICILFRTTQSLYGKYPIWGLELSL